MVSLLGLVKRRGQIAFDEPVTHHSRMLIPSLSLTAHLRRLPLVSVATVALLVSTSVAADGVGAAATAAAGATAGQGQAPEGGVPCARDFPTIALTAQGATRTLAKPPRYTQGLVVHGARLYEGAGMYGHSGVFVSALDGTEPTRLTTLDDKVFGEGLAIVGDKAYQLTWRAQHAYVYDVQPDGTLSESESSPRRYDGEGWGLATYDGQLLLSDGTSTLRLIDPDDFSVSREIPVRAGTRRVNGLNELEVIGDTVLANLYGPPAIVVIDIPTGCVVKVFDGSALARAVKPSLPKAGTAICGSFGCTVGDYVLNGIAYDEQADEVYVTGKNWPRIFVFENPLDRG
jgi:glutamine cyclotransferase